MTPAVLPADVWNKQGLQEKFNSRAAQLHTVKLLLVMVCVTNSYWLAGRVKWQDCVFCSCLLWARQLCDHNHDDRADVHYELLD